MLFTKDSRLRDVWRNPLGHDMLQYLMRRAGRSEDWPARGHGGNMRISSLERIGGKGFADIFIEMLNSHPSPPPAPAPEEPAWWRQAVLYHIYVPSFMDGDHDGVGDVPGIIQRLPYLKQLGVTAIWIWPIMDADISGERGAGDFRDVHPDTGTISDFEDLVEAAHAQELKVIISIGINSTSEKHPWFKAALAGDAKYRDYYCFCDGKPETPPNNWGFVAGSPAWSWYPEQKKWALHLQGRRRMELNWDNPQVRSEMAAVLRFWQEKGVDGMMLDSVNYISKDSLADGDATVAALVGLRGYEHFMYGPDLNRYLRELRLESRLAPSTLLMGEVKGFGPGLCKMVAGDGEQLDMAADATHLTLGDGEPGVHSGISLLTLKRYYLKWMEEFAGKRWMPLFLESPHHTRLVSRLGASPVYRGILAKLLGTMLLTLRGTPVIYQGQELGLANARINSPKELKQPTSQRLFAEYVEKYDEQVALQKVLKNSSELARTPMPWNAGPNGGFTGAQPWLRISDGVDYFNAARQMQDKSSVWTHYYRLIALRQNNPCLVYGSFRPVFAKNNKVFCYFRIYEGEKWYVEINITEKEVSRPGGISPNMKLEISNYETQARGLRPYEANLYRCE